ncbi:MAG TPA: DNA polymerase I [Levilinea sp.]|nr:DNA polymerase I [Levilinea sp.]
MPPILFLIDGHALAYRAYFALTAGAAAARFSTRSGEPTAGTFGFTSVLLKLLEQEKPEYLAVAFDTGKTFRDDIFPAYKATREKMPDDLAIQIERIRQLIDAFGIPRLEVEGYEADDVLGTVARQAVEKGMGVKILTGDRDLLQLVDDRIMVNLPGRQLSEARDYDAGAVLAYLGVRPDQIVDYKALMGDASDNIPGVPGIGEKTAVALLGKYGTLDEIYNHLEDVAVGMRKRLEAGRDSAYMSRQLAEIRCDAPVRLDLENARVDYRQIASAETLFKELDFRLLTTRLQEIVKQNSGIEGQQMSLFGKQVTHLSVRAPTDLQAHTIDTAEALQDLLRRLEAAPMIAIDTETTSADALRCDLVGISLAVDKGAGYYIPVGHTSAARQLPLDAVIAALRPVMIDVHKIKVGHNLKFDAEVLSNVGLAPYPLSFDTMIAEWLLDPASRSLGLKRMAEVYLDREMTHIEELIGKGKSQISMAETPVDVASAYAAADAEVLLHLVPILQDRLQEQNAAWLFANVEMPLIPVLIDMEQVGVALDTSFFEGFSGELNNRMIELEEQVYRAAQHRFNLNSTQQLAKVLFEKLALNPPDRRKRTSAGHFSTSAEVLEEMRGQHPVVDWILEYRELSKLKSTYVDALPLQINPRTGRVHTSFSQTGSVTGRLASSDPNLQNIPTRTDLGRRVREGFIAGEGKQLLSVDYSQIELRVVAHMSEDQAMLTAFRTGQDIHAATAAAIYGVSLDNVTKDMRSSAKAINFGLIYGISAFGLTRYTRQTLAEAEDFVMAYYRQFPAIKSYLDGIRKLAASQGYVETLLGRRRYFPNLARPANIMVRNREEREAINAPIQGTAADIMKLAMILVPKAIRAAGLKGQVLLQVHDELVLETPDQEAVETARVVRKTMENAYELSIPLETEARLGRDWGHMKVVDSG